jgi:membrane protease subunit HflK
MLMSVNGPQWGRNDDNNSGDRPRRPNRPNQGPPDLEEVLDEFKKRLAGLFGKKRGGNRNNNNGGGMPPVDFDPNTIRSGLIIVVVLAIVAWFVSGFYIVDASQRGVVLRFGKHVETTEPGLQWRWPYPVESHEIVNLSEVRSKTIGYRGDAQGGKVLKESLMLTDDENIIDLQFSVQFLLKDPVLYQFENRDPDDAVVQAAETAVREIVGKSKIDFVINTGRAQISAQVSALMQEILDRYNTGILISKVNMENAQPPEQVQAAFADAVKAGQDKESEINEGKAYAEGIVPRARGTASRLLEEANGYKQSIIANAEGDASRFKQILTEYAKAPEVTRQRMYLETMQQVYANTSKVMVDARGQGNLLYLPLDKLMQVGAGAAIPRQQAGSNANASASSRGDSVTVFSGNAASQMEPGNDFSNNRKAQGLNDAPSRELGRDREAR